MRTRHLLCTPQFLTSSCPIAAAEAWLKADIQYISGHIRVALYDSIVDASVVVAAYALNPPAFSGLHDSLLRDWSATVRMGNYAACSLGEDELDLDEDMSGAWVPTSEQVVHLTNHLTPSHSHCFCVAQAYFNLDELLK